MPCHYYTTGSSNFCSHFMHDFFYMLSLNYSEKNEVSCSVMSNSVTLLMVAHQVSLSRGLFRQEYWSGFPFPSPGDLPNPGSEPGSPALQADSLPSEPPGEAQSEGDGSSILSDFGARQAPLSMRFSRQEHWSGFPFPSPGDLPNPGIKPTSGQVDSLPAEPAGSP